MVEQEAQAVVAQVLGDLEQLVVLINPLDELPGGTRKGPTEVWSSPTPSACHTSPGSGGMASPRCLGTSGDEEGNMVFVLVTPIGGTVPSVLGHSQLRSLLLLLCIKISMVRVVIGCQ